MLAKRLKDLRKEKGITQTQLGFMVDLSQQTIGHYEVNRAHPDNETLQKLADYFNVSVDYLLGRTDNRKEALDPLPQGKDLEKIFENEVLFEGKPLTAEEKESVKKFIALALETIRKKEDKKT